MPLGLDQGVGTLVWSPLGWGRLTGKVRRSTPLPPDGGLHKTASMGPQVDDDYLYKVVEALDAVAKETDKTVPQVALNWLLQRPTISTVIMGARNEEQLRQNLASEGWNLTRSRSQDWTPPAPSHPVTPTGTSCNFWSRIRCLSPTSAFEKS